MKEQHPSDAKPLNLGPSIKAIRLRTGKTLDQVADAMGTHRGTLSKVENNKQKWGEALLTGLAVALGVEVIDFFKEAERSTEAENRPSAPVDHAQAATKTLANSLEVLARVLRTVPEPERDAVSRKLASLAMAPDSAQLLQSLQTALQPARPPIESKDIYPAVPSLFTKTTQ